MKAAKLGGGALLALLGGCRPSDFDDFVRTAPDTGVVVPTGDAGRSDGGAPDTDAAPPPMPPTAEDAGDAAMPASFCAPASEFTFCDDFETGTLQDDGEARPRAGWDWLERIGKAEPRPIGKLVAGTGGTSTRAFESAVGGRDEHRDESARLFRNLPNDLSVLHVAFDFTPALTLADAAGNYVQFFRLQQEVQVGAERTYPGVGLNARHDGLFVMVQNQTAQGFETPLEQRIGDLPTGSVRVALDVVLGDDGSLRVRIGDQPPYERNHVPIRSLDVDRTYVALGLYTIGTTASSARYDNVTMSYPDGDE